LDGVKSIDFKVLSLAIFAVSTLMLFGSAQFASAGGPSFDEGMTVGTTTMFFSGGEGEGSSDPHITVDIGPVNAPFADPIVDVCNSFDGGFASIITPNPLWKDTLDPPGDSAEWISVDSTGNVSPSNTGLYAHHFTIDGTLINLNSVSLSFQFLSDNDLGESVENIGLLLNCEPIPNSSLTSLGIIGLRHFNIDHFLGPFNISGLLEDGENILYVYTRNHGAASGIQYKFTIAGAQTSGSSGHEPPTIGKSLDGVRQVVDGGISVDSQTWTVTQGYHQEFELLQMLTSPHTISNVVHCDKGVQYCDYIAVGFMPLTGDFNNPVMTVSASKDHLNNWTIDWYDPDNYISDPGDVSPADIVFVPQIIDNKLLGTSFTIDFKNKDTGQLKLGIQVRDSYGGVRNFFFNEGVEFVDADAYPAVEAAYDKPVEVESLCFGQNNPDRNSCQFSKMKDWATLNAEETLRQMTNNQFEYVQ